MEAFGRIANGRRLYLYKNYGHLKTKNSSLYPFYSPKSIQLVSRSHIRRFIAEISIREYSDNYNKIFKIFGNASKNLLFGSILTAFRFGNKSVKFFSYIFALSISALLYIEYQLKKLYNPGWFNEKIENTREYFQKIKNSPWLKFSSFGASFKKNEASKRNDPNHKGNDPNHDNDGLLSVLSATSIVQDESDQLESIIDSEFYDEIYNEKNDTTNKPKVPEGGDLSNNVLLALTKRLLEVQSLLKSLENSGTSNKNVSMQLPSIVVVGSQSSGKSSVLEAIVGQEFLPKGNNMVTRRPIELTLVHEPNLEVPYCELPALGLNRITDFKSISQTLLDLNRSVPESECVSDVPIELRIHANNVPDLRLVDLPGYIQVTNRFQPEILKQKIRDLCEKYLKEPNIILAVCAADVDLANSEALLASRKNDPLGLRTIGVITKVDTLNPSQAVRVLTQREFPLHLGYVGVVTKPIKIQNPSKDNKTGTMVLSESQYFNRNTEFRNPRVQVGVDLLRKKLVRVLDQSMSNSLSSLVDQVQIDLEETKYQIKVQYNDERVTAESYLADSIDVLKQRIKLFKESFGKSQVRDEIQKYMQKKIVEICDNLYWNDPKIEKMCNHVLGNSRLPFLENFLGSTMSVISTAASNMKIVLSEVLDANTGGINTLPSRNGTGSKEPRQGLGTDQSYINDGSENLRGDYGNAGPLNLGDKRDWLPENEIYWNHKLDRSTGLLVKSGIGRNTTRLVVDLMMNNVYDIVNTPPFSYHPEARAMVIKIASEILRSKYVSTVEQVENTIKPFKYEIEIEPHEWKIARDSSVKMIDDQIQKCKNEIKKTKSMVPPRLLNESIKMLNKNLEKGSDLESVVDDIIAAKSRQYAMNELLIKEAQRVDKEKSEGSFGIETDEAVVSSETAIPLEQVVDKGVPLNQTALLAAQNMIHLKKRMEVLQFRRKKRF
ncbi:Protein msp1, mitochondrial [Smittium mucronatum]|uniref:Protein msp1, mitochondrial n=1 Tax=Smittium mucronatum TaxID=133383 RepID=A0A1R0H984_9FUNG|nr:Protein msp1, mitochondrial [Smittium mucronatum]